MQLLTTTVNGLYCPAGDFYIDPWAPVNRALVTHAHADHAAAGCDHYLTSDGGVAILRERVGADAVIDGLAYGERISLNGVQISLHPAGHILGSSQVRLEKQGQVVVVSGDYKLEADPTCDRFELQTCNVFVTESTFALPIFRWPNPQAVPDDINAWWRQSQAQNRTCILYCYALGKAQRLLAGLDPSIGPILVHGAVDRFVSVYRAAGIELPPTERADADNAKQGRGKAMVLAPPSAAGSVWLRKFGNVSTAFASGWMQIRGTRRRKALDRGFVLSDHADWDGLLQTIKATGAEEVLVTHGYSQTLTKHLQEQGVAARELATRYIGEGDAEAAEPQAAEESATTAESTDAAPPTE